MLRLVQRKLQEISPQSSFGLFGSRFGSRSKNNEPKIMLGTSCKEILVDHLKHNPTPIDGIDGSDFVFLLNYRILENYFNNFIQFV
jgi:hypothetical protein